MDINYNKLWNMLNEKGMKKTDLIKAAGISTNAMAKMGKNEEVRVGILIKISKVLDCRVDDLIEYTIEK